VARSRKSRQRDLQLVLMAVAVVAILIAIVFGFMVLRGKATEQNRPLNDETLCPLTGPESVTVILVDKTDAITPVTQLDVRTQLQNYAANIPKYGALYLYALDDDGNELISPVFFRCNPGSADDVDPLVGSKERSQRRFDEGFKAPLNQMLDQLLDIQESPTSPIIEGVQAAALKAFTTAEAKRVPRHLVVVSDFAQNSNQLSVYRGQTLGPDAERLGLLAPLEGVTVDLLLIQRPSSGYNPDRLLADWQGYFEMSEARNGRSLKLTGAN
jgi:hypothetical protein